MATNVILFCNILLFIANIMRRAVFDQAHRRSAVVSFEQFFHSTFAESAWWQCDDDQSKPYSLYSFIQSRDLETLGLWAQRSWNAALLLASAFFLSTAFIIRPCGLANAFIAGKGTSSCRLACWSYFHFQSDPIPQTRFLSTAQQNKSFLRVDTL